MIFKDVCVFFKGNEMDLSHHDIDHIGKCFLCNVDYRSILIHLHENEIAY